MKIINLKKIIAEEVNNFDFLNNDNDTKYQEYIDLLNNEELQKQFICDSLLTTQDKKIKFLNTTNAYIGGNYETENFDDINKLTLEYGLDIEYLYDSTKEPIKLTLEFYSDNINVGASGYYDKGDYYTQPSGDAWFDYVEWSDIKVSLFTDDGEEIKFVAFEKAPANIQTLFIREYVSSFITSKTTMDVKDKANKAAVSQYC
jgi:hypothetical protein